MRFVTWTLPQALFLLIPVLFLYWREAGGQTQRGLRRGLQLLALVALVVALAQPHLRLHAGGADLVVVVDRSASMPSDADGRAHELIGLLEKERRGGDRLGVVGFGEGAELEQALSSTDRFPGFHQAVSPDRSDLAVALERAGALIPPERSGGLLVVSDGEETGGAVMAAAQRLAARGIPVSYRALARAAPALDVAVRSFELPFAVAQQEPFQFAAHVFASRATEVSLRLERDGHVLVEGRRTLEPGENTLLFRDRIDSSGLAHYRLTTHVDGDGLPENDAGAAVLRVTGAARVLLVSRSSHGALAQAISGAHLPLSWRPPGPVSLDALEGVGSVVLENVDASTLGEASLNALAQFVREEGGGLVMTGGRSSFGEGGYRRSPLDGLLPVSLEVRQEQRRSSVAMVIVMDCSGSMAAGTPDGRTKMQLAGEGAVAALTLLSAQDEAAVYLVDTEPHEIFGLRPASPDLPYEQVARGFTGGGGILVGVALRKARDVILTSQKPTRHIVLFADASDATDAEDYQEVLADLRAHNVTVSVIGMGTPKDSDAALLKEIASRGSGRSYFAEDVTSLPRVFSQETLLVARASFVEGRVLGAGTPDLALLGAFQPGSRLETDGYNLTYAKPTASVGFRTGDENKAPLLAFQPAGQGRSAALTLEVDGSYTGPLRHWDGYQGLLSEVIRWSMPPAGADRSTWVARATQEGSALHVTVDFGDQAPPSEGAPTVRVLSDGRTAGTPLALEWEDEGRMGLRIPLVGGQARYPVLEVGGRAVRLPPAMLPYSQEFAPRDPREGKAVLERLARWTGGAEQTSMVGAFRKLPESEGAIPLAPPLSILGLLAMVMDVVVRRVGLRPSRRKAAKAPAVSGEALSPSRSSPSPPAAPPSPIESGVDAALSAARRRRVENKRGGSGRS